MAFTTSFHSSYGTVSEADKSAMKLSSPLAIDNNVTTQTALAAYEQGVGLCRGGIKKRRGGCTYGFACTQ
jgi:hypothetical protein